MEPDQSRQQTQSLMCFTKEEEEEGRDGEVIGNSLVALCVWQNAAGLAPRPSLASLSLPEHRSHIRPWMDRLQDLQRPAGRLSSFRTAHIYGKFSEAK